MPAGSDSAGKQVFRPRRARRVIYSCITLVLVVFIGANAWLPVHGRDAWGIGSRVALAGVACAIGYFLHRLASVRVEADETGVTVVNIVHRRRFDWAEIVQVRLAGDDPWLTFDLSNGEPFAAMGVQRSEGERARVQARELARLVREREPP